jgi:hypothetical protein
MSAMGIYHQRRRHLRHLSVRAYTLVEAKSHFKLPTGCSSVPWSGSSHTLYFVLVLKFHGVNRVADDRHPTSDCKCFPYRSCAECDSRSLFSASRNDVIAICVVANFIGQRHVLKLWAQKGPRNARLRSPQKKGETHVQGGILQQDERQVITRRPFLSCPETALVNYSACYSLGFGGMP